MEKLLLFIISLIITGVGCQSSQYVHPTKNTPTSSVGSVAVLSSTKNSVPVTDSTPEDPILKLVTEAREKMNMSEYEIVSYELLKDRSVLFFTLVAHERDSTNDPSDKTETVLYLYNLNTEQVRKIISSKEVPESMIFDVDNPSITFPVALPYLYVERATLSSNNRYLQLKTYDIVGGEWFFNHTILVDLETKKAKNIGSTEEFAWLGGNKFQYRVSIPYTKGCNVEVGPNVCFKPSPWKTELF